MTTKSEAGNQQLSGLRGTIGAPGTVDAPSRDPQSSFSPITEAPTSVEALIEQHARIAVIQVQHQNASYEPTPYEANALKNMRHILRKFAAALTTALAHRQTGEITQWQPIDTAPKDGTPVRLKWDQTTVEAVGRWCPAHEWPKPFASDDWRDVKGDDVLLMPTHWMRLPPFQTGEITTAEQEEDARMVTMGDSDDSRTASDTEMIRCAVLEQHGTTERQCVRDPGHVGNCEMGPWRARDDLKPARTEFQRFRYVTGELARMRIACAADAQEARKTDSGSGSWWELSGYADVLGAALKRIDDHRRRVEGIDRQIARDRQAPSAEAPR